MSRAARAPDNSEGRRGSEMGGKQTLGSGVVSEPDELRGRQIEAVRKRYPDYGLSLW